jgi:hypothetical protein
LVLSHNHLNPDGHADIPDMLLRVTTDLLVVPLTCDAACAASTGNPRYPGFIANILQLYESSNRAAIRVGYETTPGGGVQYFYQYYLPDHTPPAATVFVEPTGIDSSVAPNSYPFVRIGISSEQIPNGPGPGLWGVSFCPDCHEHVLGGFLANVSFHPDHVQFLQEVFGTRDATAPAAIFTNIQIDAYLASGSLLTEPGMVTHPVATVDQPTFAGWLEPPDATTYGGSFLVSCCQLLS